MARPPTTCSDERGCSARPVRWRQSTGDEAYDRLDERASVPDPPDRDGVLGELARRYLAGYGPASADDFATTVGSPGDGRPGGVGASDLERDDGHVVTTWSLDRSRSTPVLSADAFETLSEHAKGNSKPKPTT